MDEPSLLTEESGPTVLPEPFHERIYTVKQVAHILGLSENQVTKIFEKEPGVRDLAEACYFGKRRRMLRIPHSVLVRIWNRSEVSPPKMTHQVRRIISSN